MNKEILFFQERDGPLLPSLRLLHKCMPALLLSHPAYHRIQVLIFWPYRMQHSKANSLQFLSSLKTPSYVQKLLSILELSSTLWEDLMSCAVVWPALEANWMKTLLLILLSYVKSWINHPLVKPTHCILTFHFPSGNHGPRQRVGARCRHSRLIQRWHQEDQQW